VIDMSEPRWLRGGDKGKIPEPSMRRGKCPVCGGFTVCTDISSADGYYVAYCVGGEVKIKGVDGKVYVEECDYWDTGFARRVK